MNNPSQIESSSIPPKEEIQQQAPSKPKKQRRLTYKQQAFVKKYIQNKGNAVQSALQTYDTTDYKTASNISSENLDKPRIREAILKAMLEQGMTVPSAISLLKRQLHDDNPDLRHYLSMYFDLMDAFPTKQTETKTETRIILEQRRIDAIVDTTRQAMIEAKQGKLT